MRFRGKTTRKHKGPTRFRCTCGCDTTLDALPKHCKGVHHIQWRSANRRPVPPARKKKPEDVAA